MAGVAKKTKLPLIADSRGKGDVAGEPRDAVKKTKGPAEHKPSLDDARNRLGGRTTHEMPGPPGISPGIIVQVLANDGSKHVAVVVFANPSEVHVLIDGTKLRRVPPAAVEVNAGALATPATLTRIADDAHVFARLSEGQPVRYADDTGGLLGGKLVEKCRYGGLVVRDDGAVVAVGFRKLWPAANAGAA
ncbi:MAG: hypothetical protein JWP97_1693 [Labilithrix sp.]|nr:hypothetical protein [Labilithrix sp.]